jgi:type VI protein secretion system component Hcp
LDPDEALRMLQVASSAKGQDVVLEVENKGTVVEGESSRRYDGSNAGKALLDVIGYYFFVSNSVERGKKGLSTLTPLIVVRRCDAATASLLSLLNGGSDEIKVKLSVFKAGGDAMKDMQPTLQFVLDKVRIYSMNVLTSDALEGPHEGITFAYLSIQIDSAPQTATGQRGAVRSCTFPH